MNRYCPLCSNDPAEPRVRCHVIEQHICSSCSDILRNTFTNLTEHAQENGNHVMTRLVDISGLPFEECAATWFLHEIDQLVADFIDSYKYNEYFTKPWSQSMIRELIWRLNEIDAVSGLLRAAALKDTPQAKFHSDDTR